MKYDDTTEWTFTLAELEAICRDYDYFYGSYPEHECEGHSVFAHIAEKIGVDVESIPNWTSVQ